MQKDRTLVHIGPEAQKLAAEYQSRQAIQPSRARVLEQAVLVGLRQMVLSDTPVKGN